MKEHSCVFLPPFRFCSGSAPPPWHNSFTRARRFRWMWRQTCPQRIGPRSRRFQTMRRHAPTLVERFCLSVRLTATRPSSLHPVPPRFTFVLAAASYANRCLRPPDYSPTHLRPSLSAGLSFACPAAERWPGRAGVVPGSPSPESLKVYSKTSWSTHSLQRSLAPSTNAK
jgi:hypothetical protein